MSQSHSDYDQSDSDSSEESVLPTQEVPFERQQHILRSIEAQIKELESPEIPLSSLGQFNIRATEAMLDPSGGPCADLTFFAPY
ncbi:hypothetical protein B7463_g12018, partial [Scytalidium lignicola]